MIESRQAKMDTIIDVERDSSVNKWNTLQTLIGGDVSQTVRESDRLHQVETLIKSGKFDVNILTTSSQNLIHLLCLRPLNKCQFDYDGMYKITKLLIENDVDINQKDERGKTPLMLACQNKYTSVVDALVNLKWMYLDVSARDSSGESAFTIAGRIEDYYNYERLTRTLFWQAVVTGDMDTVSRFRNSSTEECATRFDELCVNSTKCRFPIDLRVFKSEYDKIFVRVPDFERPIRSCIAFYAWLFAILFADQRRNESMLELLLDFEKIVRATTRSGLSALHLVLSHRKNDPSFYRIFEILVDSGRFDVNALTNEEETVLHVTCRCGDPKKIESIIELLMRNKVNVNQRNSFGQTALMIACENENVVAVRKLLQWKDADGAKCDINAKYKDERTALTFAYQSNNTEVAEMIELASLMNAIENGDLETIETVFAEECVEIVCNDQESSARKIYVDAEGNMPNKEWNNLKRLVTGNLPQQIKSKRLDFITIVLASEIFDVNTMTSYSQNLLHLICLRLLNNFHWDLEENYEIARLFLENGFDFNHKDKTGRTLLMLACKNGYDSVVKALLDWDSTALDIDARDYSGETALTIAARNKNAKTFSSLSSDVLLQYVKRNDIKAVTRLLNSSRNACAICFKNLCMHPITIVGILAKDLKIQICAESDIEYPSESFVTFNGWLNAVKITDDCKYDSMLDLLLKFEEDVSGKRIDGHSALHLAVLHNQGQFELVGLRAFEILLKTKRFDVNAFTMNLETILHLSCRYLYSEKAGLLIEKLLRYKANVNQRNIFGQTALMIACENENTVAVRVLLLKWKEDYGEKLDIEARDNKGQTALSIAQHLNNKEIKAIFEHKLFLRAVESGDIETVKTYMKRPNESEQTEENPMKTLNAGILQKPPSNKSESQSETRNNEIQYEILHKRSTIDLSSLNDNAPLIDAEEIERDEVQLMSGNSVTHSVYLQGVYLAYCRSEEKNSHNDILKLLLNDELYMYEPNEEGQTILHSTVEEYLRNKCEPKGLRKIEILLNSCECNVNALNSEKETVLHLVCCRKAKENLLLDDLLKILLEYRVDLNLRNKFGKTALLIACENENTKIVRTLLTLTRNNDIYLDADEGVNYNRRFGQMGRVSNLNLTCEKKKWRQTYSFDFETWRDSVILAIKNSFEEILKYLLDYDVVVQRQYGDNGSPILNHCILDKTSSAEASLRLCEKLLESGKVNVNALAFDLTTALHDVFKRFDSQGLISLLLLYGINANQKNVFGETPIVNGIGNGISNFHRRLSAVREILDFAKMTDTWLDIDAKDAFGRTALMWAAIWKRSEAARLFLKAGASVNLTDNLGFSAMHHALHEVMSPETWINYGDFPRNIQELNHRKAIDVILYETEPHKRLCINMNELNEEKIKIVKLLLESDVDVNSLDHKGYSPMDIAVATIPEIPSHIKDSLKVKGANLNVFQNKNEQCENHANLDVNANLLHRRANLLAFCTEQRKDGNKLYMLKADKDNMAKENFSKLSANIQYQLISARDQKGRTPLHRAIISGQQISPEIEIIESEVINVVKLLISFGCSVNETDIYGRTPLHYADFNELQKLLITHGADQTAQDENGIEAIRMSKSLVAAARIGGGRIIQEMHRLLMSHGADQTAKDEKEIEAIEMSRLLFAAAVIGGDRVSRVIQRIHISMEKPKSIYLHRGKIEIQQGNIKWNKKFNPETIPKLVWEQGKYAFRHPSVIEYREEVKKFIENLASEITKRDWRFAVDPILVGSSNEETKLDLPDEFDFLFELKKIGHLCDVTFSPELPSGYVRLKRKNSDNKSMTDKDFHSFFDNNSIFIIEKLIVQFQIILRNVLSDAQFIGNHLNFDWDLDLEADAFMHFIHITDERAKTLRLRNTKLALGKRDVFHISIDIVPCIRIDGWWPDEAISKVSEEIKAFGCILVYDLPLRLYHSVTNSESCVKISFARAESEVIKRSSDAAKQAFMIAKQLIKKSGFYPLGCGTSYILKTSFLYCIEAFAPTFEKESELRMSEDAFESKLQQMDRQLWLESIMKCHLDFVSQDFCPCYFMPNFSIPVGGRLKGFHMKCLTNDVFKLHGRLFEAYRLFRSVSLHASGFDFQLPPPNPVFENFDREAMIANLRASAILNLRNAPDTYVAKKTEEVEAATADDDVDDDDDDDYDYDFDDDDADDSGGNGSGCDDGDDGTSDCDSPEVREPE